MNHKIKLFKTYTNSITSCGLCSSVGITTGYGLDGPGIESRWGAKFSAPVQTDPGAHPTFCTMSTGTFPGIKKGRGVTLTPHPLLVTWSWKGRAIPLLLLWALRPVQNLSAGTRVTFTFTLTYYIHFFQNVQQQTRWIFKYFISSQLKNSQVNNISETTFPTWNETRKVHFGGPLSEGQFYKSVTRIPYEGEGSCIEVFGGENLKERDYLGNPGIDGRILLKLQEEGWWGMNWIKLAENRDRWRALLNTVMKFRGP